MSVYVFIRTIPHACKCSTIKDNRVVHRERERERERAFKKLQRDREGGRERERVIIINKATQKV
jgi:hypothetical protein